MTSLTACLTMRFFLQLNMDFSSPFICTEFLSRNTMHKRGLCHHAVYVRLSVLLSATFMLSKRVIISSKLFHHWVATSFQFFRSDGDLLTNWGKKRDIGPISGFQIVSSAISPVE